MRQAIQIIPILQVPRPIVDLVDKAPIVAAAYCGPTESERTA
jgi:hypothetical protein